MKIFPSSFSTRTERVGALFASLSSSTPATISDQVRCLGPASILSLALPCPPGSPVSGFSGRMASLSIWWWLRQFHKHLAHLRVHGHRERFEAPNLRKLADKVAAAGFFVIVPDYFYGDPFTLEIGNVHEWLKNHGPDKAVEDTKPFIADLKSKGISSIGAAGFCWGGKVVVELSKTDDIQAAVLLHPSLVTVDDIKEVKAPLAILGAEIDRMSPPELVKQFEEILTAKTEVDSFVKIFPAVAHGWAVRYETDDQAAVQNAEEAHKHMSDWFAKYI